jgi:hypothetical protein
VYIFIIRKLFSCKQYASHIYIFKIYLINMSKKITFSKINWKQLTILWQCSRALSKTVYTNLAWLFCKALAANPIVVRDTTASYACVDRGPLHLVEHQDDLFSWKKYSNYTQIVISHGYTARYFQWGNKLAHAKV